MTLQSIVARNLDPQEAAVVTVTGCRTDTDAYNVIPHRVELRGTLRTFSEAARRMVKRRMHEIATRGAGLMGASAELRWMPNNYPVMINGADETGFAAQAARDVSDRVTAEAAANTGAEDFSFMLQACAGAYIQLGNGDTAPVHHPQYDFNDEIIPFGTSYWVQLIESRMGA